MHDNVLGYPNLAECMALEPEAALFRRFDALNARNLLFIQAELCELEKKLREIEKEDVENKDHRSHQFAHDFTWLLMSSKEPSHRQLDLITEISMKLEKYSTAMCVFFQCERANFRVLRQGIPSPSKDAKVSPT